MAKVALGARRWDLLLFLPNLAPPVPTPFDAGSIRICAGNDPLLRQLGPGAANTTARHMLAAFSTTFGMPYRPACLVIDTAAPDIIHTQATIRAFRNSCALATLLPSYDGRQWHPRFSDHFDFHPYAPARGGGIVTNDAIVKDFHPAPAVGFAAQCSPLIGNPTPFACQPSPRLLTRLFLAWRGCYVIRRRRTHLLRVFRSIELALHACRFPTDSLLSIHDAGLRLVLWVSAFETLLHPGTTKIKLATVLDFIRTLPWTDSDLRRKRFPVNYKRDPNVPPRLSRPEAVYFDLYMARNDFAHGNAIPPRRLWFRSDRSYPLLSDLAPLVYWNVLEQHLNLVLPTGSIQPPPNAKPAWLLTPKGRRYMRKRAQEWAERGNAEAALLAAP